MTIDRRLLTILVIASVPVIWMLSASFIWSHAVSRPFSLLAWWEATQWWRSNWWVNIWLTVSAAIPTLCLVLFIMGLAQFWRVSARVPRRLSNRRGVVKTRPLPIQRGVTDNHGHTEWRSMENTKKRFPGPQEPHGGLVIGEAYRVDHDQSVVGIEFDPQDKSTWGLGGRAPLLIDPCTKGARAWHSAEFAPTGSGKSSELIVKGLFWTGSSIIYDPTIEVGPRLDRPLRKRRKEVFHIGLPDPSKTIRMGGMNVLASIDITHPEAELHLRAIASRIYDEDASGAQNHIAGSSNDRFFGAMGRALVTCLLAHLVWSDPAEVEISLATFAAGMALPEDDMICSLHKIQANSPSMMARRLAGTFMQARAEETLSGIYLNAVRGVEWLFSTAYADLVSDGEFDARSLLLGNCTVFLNIDLRTVKIAPVIPRVLLGSILDTIFAANGHAHGLIGLFTDETDTLRRLDALKTVRDRGRHFGIVYHALWQSVGQMRDIWGAEETRAWIDSFSWIGYAGIRAQGSGKDLSEALGGHGVLAYSEGNNQGRQKPFGLSFGTFSSGVVSNTHEISHRLITAAQLQQDLRSDELIVVPDTGMPMRIGRAYWFRRPEIVTELTA